MRQHGWTHGVLIAVPAEAPRRQPPELVAVVATQAVALLGALLWAHGGWGGDYLLFLSLFLVGTILYLLVIALIFYRFSFVPIDAAQLSPPYWIIMGALAITTLAGTTLLKQTGAAPFLDAAHPFSFGFTLLFWAFVYLGLAAWLVTLLGLLASWFNHRVQRRA